MEVAIQRRADSPAETRYLDFVFQPIRDAPGAVATIFVQGIDITDRRRSEDALRASEARLRQLNADLERQVIERAQARGLTWRLSHDLLGALNSKGYFETANPAWESVLGWTEEEVLSMSIFDLLHPDDREHARAGFELDPGRPACAAFRQPLSVQGRRVSVDFLDRHSRSGLRLLPPAGTSPPNGRRRSSSRRPRRLCVIRRKSRRSAS